MTTTQTIAVYHGCSLSIPVSGNVTISWSGTLNKAILAGSIHGVFAPFGLGTLVIDANSIQVFSAPADSFIDFSVPFSVDVTNWMQKSGTPNLFLFTWNGIPINPIQFCVDADLTVTTTGTITVPPPINPYGDITFIIEIAIVIIVIAVAAGLFIRTSGKG